MARTRPPHAASSRAEFDTRHAAAEPPRYATREWRTRIGRGEARAGVLEAAEGPTVCRAQRKPTLWAELSGVILVRAHERYCEAQDKTHTAVAPSC